ncbi:MAG TPA: CHAT domain-containing protein, partial [Polyangium sp.]|nr:CHAT domain-containing protein [Polyangium sp.]
MPHQSDPPVWLELTIERLDTNFLQVRAQASGGEASQSLRLSVSPDELNEFTELVERAAKYGTSLNEGLAQKAQRIHSALVGGEIGNLLAQLGAGIGKAILVRLRIPDPALQRIPWEALYDARTNCFWGTSPNILPSRAVGGSRVSKPREVRETLNVLAISPEGDAGIANLRQALEQPIRDGQVEWLEPITGSKAQVEVILNRLKREPRPHVIHYIGHGGVDAGFPAIQFAGVDEGSRQWVHAHLIAAQFGESIHKEIRLIVLECCEGAKPSALGSVAESLTQAGVNAVVAHAWPVRADVAQLCSTVFYRELVSLEGPAGDVARALNAARRAIHANHEASAEAMSPILYLHRHESKIFDFKPTAAGKRMPRPVPPPMEVIPQIPPGLMRILRRNFSLVLGGRWKNYQPQIKDFRRSLHEELGISGERLEEGLPIETLAQWFALRYGKGQLDDLFQRVFQDPAEAPPFVRTLARLLRPGVHVTLLHTPCLETSLAELQPDRTINVIQRCSDSILFMRREAGATKWTQLHVVPKQLNVDTEILILRPYGGFTPEKKFNHTLLTDDDYCSALHRLFEQRIFPEDINNMIISRLNWYPALIWGLSPYTSNHRMVLHALHDRGIPRDSLAIINLDEVQDGGAE